MAASCGVTFDELAGHAGDRRAMSVVCAIRARPELKLPEAATAAAVVAIVDLDCSDVECGADCDADGTFLWISSIAAVRFFSFPTF